MAKYITRTVESDYFEGKARVQVVAEDEDTGIRASIMDGSGREESSCIAWLGPEDIRELRKALQEREAELVERGELEAEE